MTDERNELQTQTMIQITEITDDPITRRARQLAALGQLWIFIDYFHPDTEHRVNWQAALIEALPKITNDTSNSEYATIISGMLNVLDDVSTGLWLEKSEDGNNTRSPVSVAVEANGVHIVKLADGAIFEGNKQEAIRALDQIAEKVINATEVVVDMRSKRGVVGISMLSEAFTESKLARVLSDRAISAPMQKVRFYYGLKPATGGTSGSYTKFPKPYPGATFAPLKSSSAKYVVFLINEFSHLPTAALALQFAGTGYIIADGPIRGYTGNRSTTIKIPGFGFVDVRISELVENRSQFGSFKPNEVIAPNETDTQEDAAIARALIMVQKHEPSKAHYKGLPDGQFKRSTVKRSFPNKTQRILAAIRIWFIFRFFFPYEDLMEEDWDQILLDYISKFEKCDSAKDYALTVTRMVANVHDSHVHVFSDELDKFFGNVSPQFRCRMIEEKPLVTTVCKAAEKAGLKIGDVIISIDGEEVLDRMDRFRQFISASTPQSESATLLLLILKGAEGSSLKLVVMQNDNEKMIEISRPDAVERNEPERQGEVVKILPGNIGYVDLDRLPREEVKNMFDKLRNTLGIIFDVRGYPHGTAWEITPRLVPASRAGKITRRAGISLSSISAALFKCPLNPGEPGASFPGWRTFMQTIPWSEDWKYEKKTVMLIDERSISQAEHTALFLKAANGTTLIGSPTAGANGDVTNFSLPGGIKVGLTGQSVQHPDGAQLQRVGLIPDIRVSPTIKGIRDGVDEVLEQALVFIRQSAT